MTRRNETLSKRELEAHRRAGLINISIQVCDKIAFESAKKNARNIEFGDVTLRYQRIAQELYASKPRQFPPPLSKEEAASFVQRVVAGEAWRTVFLEARRRSRPHCRDSAALRLRKFFTNGDKRQRILECITARIRRHLLLIVRGQRLPGEADGDGCVPRRILSPSALNMLAEEWLRDPDALRDFLCAIFKHWHKVFAPASSIQRSIIVHQNAPEIGHDWPRMLKELQKIRAIVPAQVAVEGGTPVVTRPDVKRAARVQDALLVNLRKMSSRECADALKAKSVRGRSSSL